MNKSSLNDGYFKKIFFDHFEDVVRFSYYFCKDIEEARNIAQDTFAAFWLNIDKVNRDDNILRYLFFIAKNKTLNYLKKKSYGEKYFSYQKGKMLNINKTIIESSTFSTVLCNEIEDALNYSISKMSIKVKETFMLSRYKHLKNKEIAEKQNISIKTVEYRMMSALRIIRKYLTKFDV
ncbi:MAG: sigma-70 family RNA polymerase sigma factor [Bacteroidales bacterium]